MNKTIIMHCIEQLERIQADALTHHFDLELWASSIKTHPLDEPEPDCGFQGCFIGWAVHQQWFEPFGLHLGLAELRQGFVTASIVPVVLTEGSEPRFHQFVPKGEPRTANNAIWAIAYLMGITTKTLECVIYSEHYDAGSDTQAGDVAQRLRLLLALGEDDLRAKVAEDDEAREDRREQEEADAD